MSISVQSNLAANLPMKNLTNGSDAKTSTAADADAGQAGATPESPSVVMSRQLSAHLDLVSILNQSQQSGVGSLVNSTLETDTAKLQALNLQQQLASQPLSIANGTPSLILQLFKS